MAIVALVLILWFSSILLRAIENQKKQKNTINRIDREVKANSAIARQLEREQRVLAEEQRKQAEQLAKHEERITKLEHRMELAEREIAHYRPMLEELEARAKTIDNKIWWYEQKGLPCEGLKKELTKVNEQKFKVETKVIKAEHAIELAEKQMEVA